MTPQHSRPEQTILAVSSGGGHWQQLQLLLPAFENHRLILACSKTQAPDVISLPDCNAKNLLPGLIVIWKAIHLIRTYRPSIVVSTGAMPGLFVMIVARLAGCRTIWIDSVANSEKLSLSGRLARPFSSLHLTQWPHLSDSSHVTYAGAVL